MQNEIILSSFSIDELDSIFKSNLLKLRDSLLKAANSTDNDGLLTVQEAADFLKVSKVSIHNWKREKGLKYCKVGRSTRFKKEDLLAFAESRKK